MASEEATVEKEADGNRGEDGGGGIGLGWLLPMASDCRRAAFILPEPSGVRTMPATGDPGRDPLPDSERSGLEGFAKTVLGGDCTRIPQPVGI